MGLCNVGADKAARIDCIDSSRVGDVLEGINNVIVQYLAQIDEVEGQTGVVCTACIAFIGALMAVACSLMAAKSSEAWGKPDSPGLGFTAQSRCISGLLLGVPATGTLAMYVVADNSRKVAVYRGYLQVLEEAWNRLVGCDDVTILSYNGDLVHRFIGSSAVPAIMSSNAAALIAISVFLFVLYGGTLLGSLYYASLPIRDGDGKLRIHKSDGGKLCDGIHWPDVALFVVIATVTLVAVVCTAIFVAQIATNATITQHVVIAVREGMGIVE